MLQVISNWIDNVLFGNPPKGRKVYVELMKSIIKWSNDLLMGREPDIRKNVSVEYMGGFWGFVL